MGINALKNDDINIQNNPKRYVISAKKDLLSTAMKKHKIQLYC